MTQLSVKRIIFSAYQLYRLRLGTFIKLSLLSSLWFFFSYLLLLGIYVSFIATLFLIAISLGDTSESYAKSTASDFLTIFMIGASILAALAIFPITKGLRVQALISRIAYKNLVNAREDFQAALQQNKRFWAFLKVQLYIWIICIFSTLVVGIITNIVFHRNGKLAAIVSFSIAIFINIWIATKYWISDVTIAVENITARDSLKYSSELSRNHHCQIAAIISCVYLIVLPAYIIPFMPLLVQVTTSGIRALLFMGSSVPSILIGCIGLIIVQMFTIPLWQSVKALIYYELSNQKTSSET